MRELADLARAAGVAPVAVLVQNRERPHLSTYIGKGKLHELKAMMHEYDAGVILFDGELSPAQVRNLVDFFDDRKVLDRTELILDIFAQHAYTAEGKLQVELAQLSYLLPRLTGRGQMMDRIGGGGTGGVGVRGPGETKLETDRRRLRSRISRLKQELAEVKQRRDIERQHRRQGGLIVASLVGYTNAGKSSLLNALAGSVEVRAHDRLFETLDPTTRKVEIKGHEVLLSDTVGFIHDLPKPLVTAFRATLEEVVEADILLHVVDASGRHAATERLATEETLEQLGVENKPVIIVLNKMDLLDENEREAACREMPDGVPLSALTGEGLDELRDYIAALAFQRLNPVTVHIPYDRMDLLNMLHTTGRVISQSYRENVVVADVEVDDAGLQRLHEFVVADMDDENDDDAGDEEV